MSDNSQIAWTDATWSPTRGCSPVSEGCDHCYAARQASRFSGPSQLYEGLAHDGKWTGVIRCVPEALSIPIRWRKPRRIFVNSMSDLFHPDVPNDFIAAVFGVMAACPQHTFQVLTKRPKRMREWFSLEYSYREECSKMASEKNVDGFDRLMFEPYGAWPLPNVWLGVSVEDQATTDERIPELMATPAAVRFVSAEPLLGPTDLDKLRTGWREPGNDTLREVYPLAGLMAIPDCDWNAGKIDWVIVGGESGPKARPMHPDWVRSIRNQCVAADVPFFFKQWGEWEVFYDRDNDDPDWMNCPSNEGSTHRRYLNLAGGWGFHGDRVVSVRRVGKKTAGHLLDGVEWRQWPWADP
jgi:protein gp37